MSRSAIALGAAGVAFVVAAGTCWWLMATYLPGVEPQALYLQAGIVAKLVMLLIQLQFLAILALGIGSLFSRGDRFAGPLTVLAGVSTVFGLLGALWDWTMVQQAVARIGAVSLDITAANYAEAALVAAMGLFGAVVALGLRTMGEFRP